MYNYETITIFSGILYSSKVNSRHVKWSFATLQVFKTTCELTNKAFLLKTTLNIKINVKDRCMKVLQVMGLGVNCAGQPVITNYLTRRL